MIIIKIMKNSLIMKIMRKLIRINLKNSIKKAIMVAKRIISYLQVDKLIKLINNNNTPNNSLKNCKMARMEKSFNQMIIHQ